MKTKQKPFKVYPNSIYFWAQHKHNCGAQIESVAFHINPETLDVTHE